MDSILISVKRLLGITEEYTHFDADIILTINTVLAGLNQLGVGAANGFAISGDSETWSDFMGDSPLLNLVKTYVCQKVRLIFDPPASSAHIEAINHSLSELEFRILDVTDYRDDSTSSDNNGESGGTMTEEKVRNIVVDVLTDVDIIKGIL